MAFSGRLHSSISLRLGGVGAMASETQHMGATLAGVRDARFYFLREHFLGGKQSI